MIKSHSDATKFVDRLFEMLGDPDIGWDAARAIGGVVGADKILTKQNNAIIKVSIYFISEPVSNIHIYNRISMARNISAKYFRA